jgi:imidazolonepropionase-like amidohydrolase
MASKIRNPGACDTGASEKNAPLSPLLSNSTGCARSMSGCKARRADDDPAKAYRRVRRALRTGRTAAHFMASAP